MDDRTVVKRLLEIGADARRSHPDGYATPTDHPGLKNLGAARIANWLEALGGQGMVGDVQPCFTSSGAGFQFQVTDEAVRLLSDKASFERWVDGFIPLPPEFDVFISYAAGDAGIAEELRSDLTKTGLKCFMAEKDIRVATEWQDSIRKALVGSKRILVLLTPRSISRPWVMMETGAAWALNKPLVPALSHVTPAELLDPLRRYQARVIETTAQKQTLVNELASVLRAL